MESRGGQPAKQARQEIWGAELAFHFASHGWQEGEELQTEVVESGRSIFKLDYAICSAQASGCLVQVKCKVEDIIFANIYQGEVFVLEHRPAYQYSEVAISGSATVRQKARYVFKEPGICTRDSCCDVFCISVVFFCQFSRNDGIKID